LGGEMIDCRGGQLGRGGVAETAADAILPSARLRTMPARMVFSSHSRRIAGDGGVHGSGLNNSVYSRIRAASTLSVLVKPLFRCSVEADHSAVPICHPVGRRAQPGSRSTPACSPRSKEAILPLDSQHGICRNPFNVQRHPTSARTHQAFRASAMQIWREVAAAA
jgi:hypothetical protein